jgi:hypothetical protein
MLRSLAPELHHNPSIGRTGWVRYGCIGSGDETEPFVRIHEPLQEALTIENEVVRHSSSIDPEFQTTTTGVLELETDSIFGTELQRNPNTGFQ